MDGGLSFVEQGRESKRPGNEVMLLTLENSHQQNQINARVPAGQTDPGRHFLGYFFVAADKEVTRHKGETTDKKE